jgi:alanine racemase
VRWAWAEIDLDAISHNVHVVRRAVAPSGVWAVVKADAYGHGAVDVARTALAAGAQGLCVALVEEGIALRRAGIAAPVLLLSEQPAEQAGDIVAHDLQPTVSTVDGVTVLAAAVLRNPTRARIHVHLKLDTGMHRAGAQPAGAVEMVRAIVADPCLELASIFTHLAMADEPSAAANALQVRRFDAAVDDVRAAGYDVPLVHIANSAAALALPDTRRDLVRLGIAMYGIEPGPGVADLCGELRPALSLHARVSSVRQVAAGEGVSYGWRHVFTTETKVATVPIGYADGVPRRLFGTGGEVLVHRTRRPIVGVVTMDQLMVDCGDLPVAVGDDVVLLGAQRDGTGSDARGDAIPAEEWAARLGTIGYEIVCGISKRITRRPANS